MSKTVGESRFWNVLWEAYSTAPSMVFCRTAELEYASTLNAEGMVLDHCCGDGLIASLAWKGRKFLAGCDINQHSIVQASKRDIYERLDVCDASKGLPYEDGMFDLVFNNSAIEHIFDLDSTLAEIARVLSPHGIFAFNVFNHRYFEWWPLDKRTERDYRNWQPFFHALRLAEWEQRLASVGLRIDSVQGYFDQRATRTMAYLDWAFSGVYLARRPNLLVSAYVRFPSLMQRFWRTRLASFVWRTEPDAGSGYFIRAVRSDV